MQAIAWAIGGFNIWTSTAQALYIAVMPHTGSQWTFVLAVTAIFLSVVVTLQILSSYAKASIAAPAEILTFIEAVDSSVEENESYDRDVLRVQRLDDKLRLGRLLREIQRGGDDLREELNGLLMSESGDLTTDGYSDLRDLRLRATARLLWASKRSQYKSSLIKVSRPLCFWNLQNTSL